MRITQILAGLRKAPVLKRESVTNPQPYTEISGVNVPTPLKEAIDAYIKAKPEVQVADIEVRSVVVYHVMLRNPSNPGSAEKVLEKEVSEVCTDCGVQIDHFMFEDNTFEEEPHHSFFHMPSPSEEEPADFESSAELVEFAGTTAPKFLVSAVEEYLSVRTSSYVSDISLEDGVYFLKLTGPHVNGKPEYAFQKRIDSTCVGCDVDVSFLLYEEDPFEGESYHSFYSEPK